MSVYIKCPSCGRLLADKELLFDKGIKEINPSKVYYRLILRHRLCKR